STRKSTLVPMIRIEGVTSNKVFGGDGTYARFVGDNWSYYYPILQQTPIYSLINYSMEVEKAKGFPERMRKINSEILSDVVNIFSRGTIKSGRAVGKFIFVVKADRAAYKAAVLDALDRFNDYLFKHLQQN